MFFCATTKTPPGINNIFPLLRDKVSTLIYKLIWCIWIWNGSWNCILSYQRTPILSSRNFSQYFLIFRQLHIEQYLLVIHGQLIDGLGLVQILTENKFSMTGLSSVVDVSNIKRTKYTSQINLRALFIKREVASVSETDLLPFDWLTQKSKYNTSLL